MKIWLKGGLIVAILDVVLILFAIVFSGPEAHILALSIIQFPFSKIAYVMSANPNMSTFIIGGILTYFVIGALIGLIIQIIIKFKR